MALFIGTLQGLFQALPVTHDLLDAEDIPNIHAQLIMIGGVILALIGTIYLLTPELVGRSANLKLRRISLIGISSGIAGDYLSTLAAGLVRSEYLERGYDDVSAAAELGWFAPLAMLVTAVPMLVGFLAFGTALWQITDEYRKAWLHDLKALPSRYNGPVPAWRRKIPHSYLMAAEAFGAFAGFPGIGWMLSGQAIPGLPMVLIDPGIAWAVLPLLMSPFGDGPLTSHGIKALLIYLVGSAAVSVTLLRVSLSMQLKKARQS